MRTLNINDADIRKGSLILVNGELPLQSEPDGGSLAPVGRKDSEVLLERQAANMLSAALLSNGSGVVPVSGFRTRSEQQSIFSESLYENGADFTRRYVALPGCSEHQTGLAVDLAEDAEHIDPIRPRFPYSGVCQRFREKAAEYGFIERYPYGREHITHIAHEPWHFRYVGYPHSRIIKEREDTLEEYTAYLKRFRYGNDRLEVCYSGRRFGICFAPLGAEVELPGGVPFQLSGNNDDGVIVTLWGEA